MPWFRRSPRRERRILVNAITYSGVPIGSLLAALLAIILLDVDRLARHVPDRRAAARHPASTRLLQDARIRGLAGRPRPSFDKARAISVTDGCAPARSTDRRATGRRTLRRSAGFAGLFSRGYCFPTVLLGLTSATGLVLVYSLNTWLPELMEKSGFNAKGSLSFLLVLNGGAILGALAGSRFADRLGPKPVVASCFLIGAGVDRACSPCQPPAGLAAVFVAIVGLGTSGTQTLIYGFVANYYPTRMSGGRGWPGARDSADWAGSRAHCWVGSCSAAGLPLNSIFYVFAAVALVGLVLTLLVPIRRSRELHSTVVEPTPAIPGRPGAPAKTS